MNPPFADESAYPHSMARGALFRMSLMLLNENEAIHVSLFPAVFDYTDRKPLLSHCFEHVYAASFHGGSRPIRMEAWAPDIAFLASIARTAPESPGLVVPIKKDGPLNINEHLIELLDGPVVLLPAQVQENPVGIRVEDRAHLLRCRSVGWAAQGFPVSWAPELTFHPYPRCCVYF